MLGEELVVQVEGAEHHVDHRHVVLVRAVEGVVEDRDVGPGGIQHPKLIEPAGVVDVRQQVVEKLHVALAIEDHHGDVARAVGRLDHPGQVLADDVLEQGGLARAGHAQDDPLHDPDAVGPQVWAPVSVIAEDDGVLGPGFPAVLLIHGRLDHQRRVGPLLLASRSGRGRVPARKEPAYCKENDVAVDLRHLSCREVKGVDADIRKDG